MPFRRLLALLLLAGCGGGGGPSDDPGGGGATVVIQKPVGSGDAQSGVVGDTLAAALMVLVTEDGVPAPGRVVTFAPAAGSGTAVPTIDTTDGDGIARTAWILGTTAGARQLQASTPGAGGSPLVFSATALPAAPASLAVSSGQGQAQEAGLPFQQALTVRVADAFNNGIPGIGITWEVVAGSATLNTTASTTGATGQSSVTVQAGGTPGEVQVRAVATPLSADTVAFALTVVPAASVITIGNNFFAPANDTIPVGGAVRWVWNGGTHDVAPVSGPVDFPGSGVLSAPSQYGPIVFGVAGTYTYQCNLHAGMTGTITVQ